MKVFVFSLSQGEAMFNTSCNPVCQRKLTLMPLLISSLLSKALIITGVYLICAYIISQTSV